MKENTKYTLKLVFYMYTMVVEIIIFYYGSMGITPRELAFLILPWMALLCALTLCLLLVTVVDYKKKYMKGERRKKVKK